MTSPGRYRNEPPDIIDEFNRLKRRVDALEQNPRAGNTTVDSGTFRVRDANGDVRVQVGLLSDGSYGMEVLEDGALNFHQIPFVYTASAPNNPGTGENCASNTYTDLTTIGPRVTVPVRSSGRILVIATAQIQFATAFGANVNNEGRFDVAFSGANTRNPNELLDPLVGFFQLNVIIAGGNTTSIGPASTVTAQAVFEGLNPGNTTITMKYRNNTNPPGTTDFFRRVLTVINL